MDERREFEKRAKHPITEIFAWVTEDEEQGEAIFTFLGKGGYFPAIGSDLDRAMSLRGIVETICERHGRKVRLCKFSDRKDITLRHLGTLKKERGTYDKQ